MEIFALAVVSLHRATTTTNRFPALLQLARGEDRAAVGVAAAHTGGKCAKIHCAEKVAAGGLGKGDRELKRAKEK